MGLSENQPNVKTELSLMAAVFWLPLSALAPLRQQEPHIFTDATDQHRLSMTIRSICVNLWFLPRLFPVRAFEPHLKKLVPTRPVARNFADLEPPSVLVQFDREANLSSALIAESPNQALFCDRDF